MIDRHLQPLSPPNSITLLLSSSPKLASIFAPCTRLCFNFCHENLCWILRPLSFTRTTSSFTTSRWRQLHQRLDTEPLFRNSFIWLPPTTVQQHLRLHAMYTSLEHIRLKGKLKNHFFTHSSHKKKQSFFSHFLCFFFAVLRKQRQCHDDHSICSIYNRVGRSRILKRREDGGIERDGGVDYEEGSC